MLPQLLARLAVLGGGRLLDRAMSKVVPAGTTASTKSSLAKAFSGAALARIVTGSVPGAIIVGGGMLAKLLYDRRRRVPADAAGPIPDDEDDSNAIG